MVTSNDPTLVVSSKPCQSAQTSKTSEHAKYVVVLREPGVEIWVKRKSKGSPMGESVHLYHFCPSDHFLYLTIRPCVTEDVEMFNRLCRFGQSINVIPACRSLNDTSLTDLTGTGVCQANYFLAVEHKSAW